MFATLGHVAMKSFMIVWLYTSPHSWRGLPVPEPGPPVVVAGPHLLRVLLCGSGIVVGYGVASPELALGGSLARSLAALTNRGAEVTTVASARLNTKAAQIQLHSQILEGVDAVVLSFGTFELLTYLPAKSWGRGLGELIDSVIADTSCQSQIFVIGCTAPRMSNFTGAYRRHLLRMTSEYNEEVRSLAQRHDRVHQIEFTPEPEDHEAIEGRQSYRLWADAIAPTIATQLDPPPTSK
ncbi:hypothetical protein GCM10009655_17920 [Rhodoglobus aureus]|uniref:SGNH hydrolase-type esterase domain-containing protein n=2 Tax=Rhodoglobus aureus TaxID=191497 RepID=A0ABP4GEP2_9MICO